MAATSAEVLALTSEVQGLHAVAERAVPKGLSSEAALASAVDFVLEGLYATKKISRSEERTYSAVEPSRGRQTQTRSNIEELMERESPHGGGKKRYYN